MTSNAFSASASSSLTARRLMAAANSGAVLVFFVLGLGLGLWNIAWVVFLAPGVLRAWFSVQDSPRPENAYGDPLNAQSKPYPY